MEVPADRDDGPVCGGHAARRLVHEPEGRLVEGRDAGIDTEPGGERRWAPREAAVVIAEHEDELGRDPLPGAAKLLDDGVGAAAPRMEEVAEHDDASRRVAGHELLEAGEVALGRAFRQDAVYVTEGHRETGVDFIEQQFECTKTPLGLKLLLTLAFVGEAGMAANIEALFGLARRVHEQISRREGFETLCPPESNILCFRYAGDDAFQSRTRQELMRRGDFLLTQADVAGRRWLRLTLMNPLTNEATIERLLETIESLGRDLGRE